MLTRVAIIDRMQTFNNPPGTLHVSQREIPLRVNVRRATSIWNWREQYAFVVSYTLHEVFVCLVHISEGARIGTVLYNYLVVCSIVVPHFQAFLRTGHSISTHAAS